MRAGECELAHTSTLATRSKLGLAAQIVSRIARLAQGADAGEKGWEPSWPKLRTDHVLAGRPGVHPSSETRKLGIGCVCCWLRGPEPQMMLPNLADCTRRRQPEVAKSDTPRLEIAKTTISASFPKLARNPGVKNRTHDDCQYEQHPDCNKAAWTSIETGLSEPSPELHKHAAMHTPLPLWVNS